jgi:DNA-binding MarR family transcriptional regulator
MVRKPAKNPAPTPEVQTEPLDRHLRNFAGYNVKRASNIMQSNAARSLEPFGLRITTFSALCVIVDNPDVTQSQLAAALNMERSNTVLIIDALEEAGLIGRFRVPTDRRSYALRATLAGIKRRDAASRALAEAEEERLVHLTEQERAQLTELLRRIDATD